MAQKISRWYATQNATFRRYIAFRIPNTNPVEYVLLDGSTFDMQVRAKPGATGAAEATATITVTDTEITTPSGATIPAGYAALIEIPAASTLTLKPTKHAFDVFRTNADGSIDAVVSGEFHVAARVTII